MRQGCRERFSCQLQVSDPDMHHGTCVTVVPWCIAGSLTSGFLCSRWRGKRSRHSRRMRNPQFYVSGKRTMSLLFFPGPLPGFWLMTAFCVLSTQSTRVTYNRNNLRSFPDDIPFDTTKLTFTNEYYLTIIPANAFHNLTVLTYLEVSRSTVNYISDGAFSDLDALTNLQLYQSEIRHLPDLGGIGDTLTILNLENNPIAQENISCTLAPLLVLEELKLNSCGLTGLLSLPELPALKGLYVNSNSINRLDSHFFKSLVNLQVFQLAQNQLQHMDLAFPASLTNLHYYNNKIPSVTRSNVSTLIGVNDLNLGLNAFSSLEDHTFIDLDVLTSLALAHLGLTTVPELSDVADTLTHLYLNNNPIPLENTKNLYGLDQLRRLDLQFCELSGILTLPTFQHMVELNLNNNQLTRLSPGIFHGYERLTRLSLQNNQINILGIPTDFPITLTRLDLSVNPITVLPREAFAIGDNTSNLREVKLFGCDISTVELGAFNGLDHVTTVRMYGNAFTRLTSGQFLGLSGTTHMYLYDSSLTGIEVGSFNGQQSVTFLDLSDNALITLQESTFQGLVSLTQLELDNNDLSTLERRTFQELGRLTKLYLNNNMLTRLVRETFLGLVSLTYLNLQVNSIRAIEKSAFSGLYKLQQLYLNDNSLVTFPEITDMAGSLVTLHIYNNPTMTYMNASYLINFNSLREFHIYSCLLSGELNLPMLPSLQTLLASSNRLTGISPNLFRGFNSLSNVDLNSNQFGKLPLFEDSSGTFDPSSNQQDLTHVGFDRYFNLKLQYNQIVDVPQASISRVTRGRIYLENNPIDCGSMCWMFDCRTRTFTASNVNFPRCDGQPWNGIHWSSGDAAYLCPRKLGKYSITDQIYTWNLVYYALF